MRDRLTDCEEILKQLKSLSNPDAVAGMARFGITPKNTYGVSIPVLRKMAKQIGKNHLLAAGWSRGGKELVYSTDDNDLVAVPIEAGAEIRPGAPRKLFTVSDLVTGGDVTADGERFLFSAAAEAPHREIHLFLNWTAELPR